MGKEGTNPAKYKAAETRGDKYDGSIDSILAHELTSPQEDIEAVGLHL